jgi:hypothetical protein
MPIEEIKMKKMFGLSSNLDTEVKQKILKKVEDIKIEEKEVIYFSKEEITTHNKQKFTKNKDGQEVGCKMIAYKTFKNIDDLPIFLKEYEFNKKDELFIEFKIILEIFFQNLAFQNLKSINNNFFYQFLNYTVEIPKIICV